MKKLGFIFLALITISQFTRAQIYATFVGDTTKIWDANFGWACAGRFFPIINTSQDTIYITECDTMDLATCSCTYTICTSLIGLKAGIYTAVINRQWKYHVTYGRDTTIGYTIYGGSVTFSVLNSPSLLSNIAFYQSGCLGSGDKVENKSTIPNSFAMLTNYPNPFNPTSVIRYTIPHRSHTIITIFNCIGQYIKTLVDEIKQSGTYEIGFDGHNLSSGVYFCCLKTGNQTLINKLNLLK